MPENKLVRPDPHEEDFPADELGVGGPDLFAGQLIAEARAEYLAANPSEDLSVSEAGLLERSADDAKQINGDSPPIPADLQFIADSPGDKPQR